MFGLLTAYVRSLAPRVTDPQGNIWLVWNDRAVRLEAYYKPSRW